MNAFLSAFLRVLFAPWKLFLQFKVRQMKADAQARLKTAPVAPVMTVVGSPPIRITKEPSPAQQLDFYEWRSPTYVGPMSDGVADSLARCILRNDPPAPVDVPTLNRLMLNTPAAYMLRRDGDRWIADFDSFSLHTFRAHTVREYRFEAAGNSAEVLDTQGRVHRPGDALWETALAHTVSWWTISVHSGLHNWVHFNLPDTVAEAHTLLSRPDTRLARLLAPHVRFTSRINREGLWANRSTGSGPEFRHLLKLTTPGSTRAEGFQQGAIENTARHYADLPAHFEVPKNLDDRIPYFAYLKAYFRAIDAFVARLDPLLEDDAWTELAASVDRGLPGFSKIPRAQALAEFIWQVGVVHAADHLCYVREAYAHGFHRVPEAIDRPFTWQSVGAWDRFRTRNLFNVFVNFNNNPALKHSLLDIENYRFEPGTKEHTAAEQFRSDLLRVDGELIAAGNRRLPVGELLQSVCF